MRRHAANIFNYRFNNRRRGEWNPLLLVMFALLTVAPAVLAAAPLQNAAAQPQAVWQWLQSPEGASTRDLLQQALDLENLSDLPPAEMAALFNSGLIRVHSEIDNPLPDTDPSVSALHLTAPDKPFWFFAQFAIRSSHSTFASVLSSHEAAKLSGIRTNRRLN